MPPLSGVQLGFRIFVPRSPRKRIRRVPFVRIGSQLGFPDPCPPQLFTGTTIMCRSGIRTQDDLYTTKWGKLENRDIEQFFFGRIDTEGRKAAEYFAELEHPDADKKSFLDLMNYMSVQKLRTPKGIG
ncbi:MAG: hypothetical protein ACLPKW_32085 [Acetobacteraceae bacterium]